MQVEPSYAVVEGVQAEGLWQDGVAQEGCDGGAGRVNQQHPARRVLVFAQLPHPIQALQHFNDGLDL